MKKIKILSLLFLIPMIPLFAQNQALYIDSTGRIGIGTSKPVSQLHIIAAGGLGNEPIRCQSNSTFLSGFDATGTERFAINNDAGPTLNFMGSWDSATSVFYNFLSFDQTNKKTLTLNGGAIILNGTTAINGVKIFNFSNNQSPYLMKGMAQNFSTLTISAFVDCQSPGVSAMVLYDAAHSQFKIISQVGTGQTNRVEVSPSSKNTLNFYNDCGLTATLTFTQSGADVTATITTSTVGGVPNPTKFSIISQGF